jgi:hypothetical protein
VVYFGFTYACTYTSLITCNNQEDLETTPEGKGGHEAAAVTGNAGFSDNDDPYA